MFIHSIINAGLSDTLPEYLRRKVQPTNILALLLMFAVAIPFIIISLVYAPVLAIVPAVGALTCIGAIIANKYGAIKYSRVFLAIMPVTLGAVYNAFLSYEGEEPIASVYLIELSFSLVIFVVFDLKERQLMIPAMIYAAILIISFPITKNWVNLYIDTHFIRHGWLSWVTVILGVITGFGAIYGLALLNKFAEEKSEKLLQEMNDKNKNLQENETRLKENIKLIEEAQANEQKRNWATEGIAKVADILRAAGNDDKVFDQLAAEIVKFVKANQGSLYVTEEDEDGGAVIRLKSCYAYDRKKFIDQEFKPGQGLVGQAYKEKEHVYLTEIPQNYVRITSGLGDATPTSLVIMPLKINETIEGIIEIASFRKFEPYQIEFLEKAGETIASYIQGHKINRRTQKLLQESMETSQKMREQEEEMRQNMEELAATQEELSRKEKEYLRRIEELENKLKNVELTT